MARLERFAKQHRVSVVQFRKGERRDDVAAEYPKKVKGEEGVLFIGKAQEKNPGLSHGTEALKLEFVARLTLLTYGSSYQLLQGLSAQIRDKTRHQPAAQGASLIEGDEGSAQIVSFHGSAPSLVYTATMVPPSSPAP